MHHTKKAGIYCKLSTKVTRKKSSFLQWIKFILPSIFPVPLKLKEMWYVLSSDAKYCSELLVRLCECCQEINFPSYFISRLEKYKAELMYLFDRQVDGYTLPQVAVCLKDSIAYLIYNLSWLVCIPVLFNMKSWWWHARSILLSFKETRQREKREWGKLNTDQTFYLSAVAF